MDRLVPKQVVIEVTNACNLQCKLCPTVCQKDFPVGHMTLKTFMGIVDKLDFETKVIPWLLGEPLLNPEYHLMLAYLRKKKIRYYVTTNLTIWRDDVFTEIFHPDSTCYQVIVSLDGMWGTGNIEKARPGSNENQLKINIQKLLDQKKASNTTLDIAVKICERGQDWGEIEDFVQAWVQTVDYVVLGKPLKGSNEESMRTKPCQYSDANFMVIRWTGDCVMCGYEEKIANKLLLSYGKVEETTDLLELFNNASVTKFREDQRNGIYPEPCSTCTFAYTGVGFQGKVAFRNNPKTELWFQQDYYNTFFSKTQRWKLREYYIARDATGKP